MRAWFDFESFDLVSPYPLGGYFSSDLFHQQFRDAVLLNSRLDLQCF